MEDIRYTYRPTFGTARAVGSFISAVGWFGVAVGVFMGLSALVTSGSGFGMAEAARALSGLGSSLVGIVIVAVGQLLRAMATSADCSAEVLKITQAVHDAENMYKGPPPM